MYVVVISYGGMGEYGTKGEKDEIYQLLGANNADSKHCKAQVKSQASLLCARVQIRNPNHCGGPWGLVVQSG